MPDDDEILEAEVLVRVKVRPKPGQGFRPECTHLAAASAISNALYMYVHTPNTRGYQPLCSPGHENVDVLVTEVFIPDQGES